MSSSSRIGAALAAILCPAVASAQISFGPASLIPTGTRPGGVVLADFNGDGHRDAAVSTDSPDTVSVLLNDGTGTLGAPVPIFQQAGTGPDGLAAGDFDGNGTMDLLVALHNVDQVRPLYNQGGNVFTTGTAVAVGAGPRALATAHFDGNGFLDAVVSSRDGNSVSVLLNSGTAFTATSFATGNDPRFVTTGDFDGNGSSDVAVSVHDDRNVRVFSNNGAGALSVMADLSVGAQLRPDGITSADLDGDGDLDLAVATSGNGLGFASIFLNKGGFAGFLSYSTGADDPSQIVAGDFDLDCDLDLATANQDAGSVSVLPGTGAGAFGAASLLAAGTTPENLAAGDLDANGSAELIVANRDSNNLGVYSNAADASFADLGFALTGTGTPSLSGAGPLCLGANVRLNLSGAPASTFAVLVVGFSNLGASFKGGTLVPSPNLLFAFRTDAVGGIDLNVPVRVAPPVGQDVFFQYWMPDAGGPAGFTASNALQATTP